MYHLKLSLQLLRRTAGLAAGAALMWIPVVASAEQAVHATAESAAMSHQTPAWAEQLKGQTVMEDAMEGRPERASMVERQHERIMLQMGADAQAQHTDGMF